jgi:hypothetical protein
MSAVVISCSQYRIRTVVVRSEKSGKKFLVAVKGKLESTIGVTEMSILAKRVSTAASPGRGRRSRGETKRRVVTLKRWSQWFPQPLRTRKKDAQWRNGTIAEKNLAGSGLRMYVPDLLSSWRQSPRSGHFLRNASRAIPSSQLGRWVWTIAMPESIAFGYFNGNHLYAPFVTVY